MKTINTKTAYSAKKAALMLIVIYATLTALRMIMALLTTAYPMTIPDEFLYFNMARSFGTGNGAMMYGQKADYSFFVFPMILSPVYRLFPAGTDYYRLLQAESIIIMNLSVFPVYAIAHTLCKDDRKAMGLTVLSLMQPDFILSARILSESVLFPVFYLMVFCALRAFREKKTLDYIWVGALGALMFAIKPGQIVPACVIFAAFVIFGWNEERKAEIRRTAIGIASMAAVGALFILANKFLINPGTTVFSVYDSQIVSSRGLQLGAFLKGVALSPYTFILACGIAPFVFSVCNYKKLGTDSRKLVFVSLVSAAVLMLGAAFTINRVEIGNPTVHTRYIGMLIPIIMTACIAEGDSVDNTGTQTGAGGILPYIMLGYAAVAVIAFGYDGMVNADSASVFNYAVAWVRGLSGTNPGAIVLSVAVIACIAALTLLTVRRKKKAAAFLLAVCCVFTFLNNVTAYVGIGNEIDSRLAADTAAVNEELGTSEYLYVFADFRVRYDALQDVNSRSNGSKIYVNDLYNNMLKTKGVYEPFVPEVIRGDIPDRNTADTDIVLLDRDADALIKWSPDVQVLKDTETMKLVRIPKGERCIDAMVGGFVGDKLSTGTKGVFTKFADDDKTKLVIDMELSCEAKIVISAEGMGEYEFTIPAGRDSYTIDAGGADIVTIYTEAGEITLYGFEFAN